MGTVQFDFHELDEFRRRLEQAQIDYFFEACAKELAARLLRAVIKRTPVGEYEDKQGGTLRRGWTAGETSNVVEYVGAIKVQHYGNVYKIEISNPVEYAPYVEYGHRQEPGRYVPAIGKRLKKGWVPGKFMLTISEKELREMAPALLETRLKQFLEGVLHD